MRVAIVHYHLRPGGVTRVIEHAVASLGAEAKVVVLSGEPYGGEADLRVRVVEGLGYGRDFDPATAKALAVGLEAAATEVLGGAPDLWHCHNHSLGKNLNFPLALYHLLEHGARVLLQVHDFAEDGRPSLYAAQRTMAQHTEHSLGELLYPQAAGVHYAVLNNRDRGFLREAGVPEERLHLLPNAVHLPPQPESVAPPPFPEAKQLYVYPTRGIRRKNLGELVLLAALAPEGTVLATTLGPANPEWRPYHERWEQCLARHRLPVRLAAVEKGEADFAALMARADALLSTSIAEGFGLAFLEPWLLDKPLVGRDLPDITLDFRQEGLDLNHLYARLEVPLEWVGERRLREDLHMGLEAQYKAYGLPLPAHATEEAFQSLVQEARVDFGRLHEPLQEQAVIRTLTSPLGLHEGMAELLRRPTPVTVAHNRSIVEDRYALPAYGERLQALYASVAAGEARQGLDGLDAADVLRAFLQPARFNLLRT